MAQGVVLRQLATQALQVGTIWKQATCQDGSSPAAGADARLGRRLSRRKAMMIDALVGARLVGGRPVWPVNRTGVRR